MHLDDNSIRLLTAVISLGSTLTPVILSLFEKL